MKRILGLDLGTNSIGWAIVQHDMDLAQGEITASGSRIIPMSQEVLSKFGSGVTESQTAERTRYRSMRRLYERYKLRRERLHRVMNVMGYLPAHYAEAIDFEQRIGQFKPGQEPKITYRPATGEDGAVNHEFLFIDAFKEMAEDFKSSGHEGAIPFDWTLYYLRKKALTQRISPEELCWVLLSFNQKRGYYQLRGEEEPDDTKDKRYMSLKVKELIDTGKEVKGKKLYEVIFENGWKYNKEIVKTEDWEGRTKEFIVTISELKNGEKKYSYKAVDSEVDWIAIKAKTELDLDESGLTIGAFIYHSLLRDPMQKIRGKLIKTVERKYYKEELTQILQEQQKHHEALCDPEVYRSCVKELYPRNQAHQNQVKDRTLSNFFIDDIIFYQRPLKSKKSSIGGCRFEQRRFKRKDEESGQMILVSEPIPAISKSHPLYQEFRLWQFVRNLKIIDKRLELSARRTSEASIMDRLMDSDDDWIDLYDFLNQRAEVEEKHIISYFIKNKKIAKENKEHYAWNYVADKKYPCNVTRSEMLKRLKKVEGLEAEVFLTHEIELSLWHLIYSISDREEYIKAIKKFATKHHIDQDSFEEAFMSMPPYESSYASLSYKAIRKLLQLMRMGHYWDGSAIHQKTVNRIDKIVDGEYDEKIRDRVREKSIQMRSIEDFKGLPLWLASYVVYDRHSESEDMAVWTSPDEITQYLQEFKQHRLRNPIVEQVVTETLRVVRDIWIQYGAGQEGYFDEIHLEMGRDLKNSAEKRKRMSENQRTRENTNERIRKLLEELSVDGDVQGDVRSYSPSHQELLKIYEEGIFMNPETKYERVSEDEILKIRRDAAPSRADIQRYKLWLNQGYTSPYTGQIIPLSKLFTSDYEVEHVIPRSRYFDDSLSNKVICESEINSHKDNRTAYEYMQQHQGDPVAGYPLLSIDQYEKHCQRYFKNNRNKLANLLSEDIPEGFISRQMNDSRYISKFIKGVLSNIVREDGEQEPTAKRLLPVTGAITAKLKRDWGIHDQWNELVAPRFKRLNELTQTEDYGYWDDKIRAFRIAVPSELRKGFSSKRIDHRHHAMDAIIIACTTRGHVQYFNTMNAQSQLRNKLMTQNAQGDYTKYCKLPWSSFPVDAKRSLEQIIISFKQNLRVINKATNKTWQWVDQGGQLKKKLVVQKGANWAIRKPLHKETISGHVKHVDVPKGKIATASRVPLASIKNQKHIDKITDISIQKILNNHLANYIDEQGKPQFAEAFSQTGIEDMNQNIQQLNGGVAHMPIYKVRQYEIGKKFAVGHTGTKAAKYVEAAKGTNLFFAIYWDEQKQKRVYDSVPFYEVMEHQKQVAHLPAEERTVIQAKPELGALQFTLSPNDLVYVPTREDIMLSERMSVIDDIVLDQNRIYKMVSSSGRQVFFVKAEVAKTIVNKQEYSALNKMEKSIEGIMIKEICWKLDIDRLGHITKIYSNNA